MWWERQLGDVAGQVAAVLRAHGRVDVEAIASDVVLDLVRLLRVETTSFPKAWFGNREPGESHRKAFRVLVRTLARRRYLDHLRRQYVRARELPSAEPDEPGLEARVDARVLLVQLARLLERLPEGDRDLVTGVLDPAQGRLGARDRQRLARVRKRLATDLAASIRQPRRGR